MKNHRPGFTLNELATLLVVAILGAILLALLLPQIGSSRQGPGPQLRDAAQVRELHKALVMWSQQNRGLYPQPSALDRDNETLASGGEASLKDSTGAIYSLLVFNSLVTPDLLVSPHETNPAIRVFEGYEYAEPQAAAEPRYARWDPAFRGTPLDPPAASIRPGRLFGHTSYAHLAVAGSGRMSEWRNTLSSNYAVVGNRGPEEVAGAWDPATGEITATTLAEGPTGTQSLTLLIHGSKLSWEGNIAYNDNHVNFEITTYPEGMLYTDGEGDAARSFGDGLFLDEGDPGVLGGVAAEDVRDANCYLGLFRRGPAEAERTQHGETSSYLRAARWHDGMTK